MTDPLKDIQPVAFASEYGIEQVKLRLNHYMLFVTKRHEKEFNQSLFTKAQMRAAYNAGVEAGAKQLEDNMLDGAAAIRGMKI